MKAYIITFIGIMLSIISLILFLTLGQIFFVPLIFILPLSGTCFRSKVREDSSNIFIEPLGGLSKNYIYIYKCPFCDNIIHEEHPKYCSYCGKELNRQSDNHD